MRSKASRSLPGGNPPHPRTLQVSTVTKSSTRRRRRAGNKKIPDNAIIVPNVPEDDYYSPIPGVYYHFAKLEWRATCRDPFNCSKRTQKTFGVRKYGFYEAKLRAEVAAHEWDKHRQLVSFLRSVTNTEEKEEAEASPPQPPPNSPYDAPYMPYDYTMMYPWTWMPPFPDGVVMGAPLQPCERME